MGEEDPTTREMRLDQIQRELHHRSRADDTPVADEATTEERRADRAAYLRRKLEERAAAERDTK